ncbi:MAG: 2-oxoisovalerate dehydrogenase [Fimbriimonadales bacterium]
MKQIVFEVTESIEGGFEASALGHRIHTQGEDWDDLKAMIQDAVRCHFEEADRPALIRLLFTREEVLSA